MKKTTLLLVAAASVALFASSLAQAQSDTIRKWSLTLYVGFVPADAVGPMPFFQPNPSAPKIYYQGPSIILPSPANPTGDTIIVEVKYPPGQTPLSFCSPDDIKELAESGAAAGLLSTSAKATEDKDWYRGFRAAIELSTRKLAALKR